MVALEAELGILPIDIRLQKLNRMECLKLLRTNDNSLKEVDSLIHKSETLPFTTSKLYQARHKTTFISN